MNMRRCSLACLVLAPIWSVLAVLGPGRFNRSDVELWPATRVISEAHANRTWPQELVAVGTQADEPLALDTRHLPASVVTRTDGGFEEIDDNLLGLLAFAVDSSVEQRNDVMSGGCTNDPCVRI
jgi:hypothetical protein